MTIRLTFILFVIWLLASTCQAFAGLSEDVHAAPPEKQLAFLNDPGSDWYHLDARIVARFKSLLNQLSHEYPETPKEIADSTVRAQSVSEEEGVGESLLSIMESVNRIAVGLGPDFNATYRDIAIAYITLRIKGYSAQEAAENLRDLYMTIISTKPSKK